MTQVYQNQLAAVSKHGDDGICSSKVAILDDILGGTRGLKPEKMGVVAKAEWH